MPFYSLHYILSKQDLPAPGIILCGRCGQRPNWHSGAANRPDLPIQLRCDYCMNQCAEFLTEEARDAELKELDKRARAMNTDLHFDRPKGT
jgi:hypothetical protein